MAPRNVTLGASSAGAPPATRTDGAQDPPSSGPPPARYELTGDHRLSWRELGELRKTDPAAAQALQQAQTAYASLLGQGAKIVVTRSAGNGGRPVLAIVPPSLARNTDASKPYLVQVHYHGVNGSASQPNPGSPLTSRIAQSFQREPPTVFVLPEWKGTDDWSNVLSTGATAADATLDLVGAPGPLTVSAHSLGRNAVLSAIDHDGLEADRLDMQDAFFKTQPEGPRKVAQWAAQHPTARVRVLTTTTREMSDMSTIKSQATWPKNVQLDDQSRLGNHRAAELLPW